MLMGMGPAVFLIEVYPEVAIIFEAFLALLSYLGSKVVSLKYREP